MKTTEREENLKLLHEIMRLSSVQAELTNLREALKSWPATWDSENRMVMRFTRDEWNRLLY